MPRKEENVVVPEWGGRDAGKIFKITEKLAIDAEKWAWRMVVALKGTSGHIPTEAVERLGIVGISVIGLNAFLAAAVDFRELSPLLDELLDCVTIIRDQRHVGTATPLMPDDIEEIRTVAWLRSEVLRVHTGFSPADGLLSLVSMIRASADSQTTSTSLP